MKLVWALVVALSAGFGGASAQTVAPPAPAAAPIPAPPVQGVRLAADTRISIELTEPVSSKDRARGDKFAIRLAAPIVIDGQTLTPAGATGIGEVVYAERGGAGGAPGKLVLAARYIDLGGVRVHLKAFNLGAGGESEFREMQVAASFIGPAVMFINGHDVLYPVGTRARAKVAQDVVLPSLAPVAPPTAPPPPTVSTQEPPK